MKSEKEILKYLSGIMSGEEQNQFQLRMSRDISLKNKVEEINKTLSKLNDNKEFELDDNYFNNLRVKVRNRIESTEKGGKTIVRYALTLSVTAILIFILSSDFNKNTINSFTENQLTWDDYFNSASNDYLLPASVNIFYEFEDFTFEEKLNFVSGGSNVINSELNEIIPELDKRTINEIENKKIL